MANYSAIKAAVNAYIKANGKKEITGRILNSVLNATIDSLGRFFQFAGEAIPTDDPGTPDQNVCYLAGEPGVYTNFGGITIENEEVALLFWDGEWTKQRILIGIQEVEASVDNQVGTPSVDVSYSGGVLVLTFHNLKGEQGDTGDPAGFGTIEADITGGVGTPGVSVESSGDNTAKNLMFHFTNLKGETGVTSVVATIDNTSGTPSCQVSLVNGVLTLAFSGLKGLKGDTGVSADYPITIYNGLDSDATDQALSVAQGKVLDGKISQLGQQVIYDVTANNASAKFASLSALLSSENLSTLIPVAIRCGGMSIRFVQSPDNKYVQYRLIANEWSTNTDDWAIADEGVYVENPEFAEIHTDAEGKVLYGVKQDGDFHFGAGIPPQIVDALNSKVNIETGKGLINTEVANAQSTVASEEFLKLITDEDNRIILGIRKNGAVYIPSLQNSSIDAQLQEAIAKFREQAAALEDEVDAKMALFNEFFSGLDNPEWLEVTVDGEGKIIKGIKKDGSVYPDVISPINERLSALETRFDNKVFDAPENDIIIIPEEAGYVIATMYTYILEEKEIDGVATFRFSTDLGKTWIETENFIGDIAHVHIFLDGTVLICGRRKAYTTKDFVTFTESIIYDIDGTVLTQLPRDGFYSLGHHDVYNELDGKELEIWGEYILERESNVCVWYTIDKGATIRCAFKFGESQIDGQTIICRHIHKVTFCKANNKVYVTTGDAYSSGEDHVLWGSVNTTNNTWTWGHVADGRMFKLGMIWFDDLFAYIITDYTEIALADKKGILCIPIKELDNVNDDINKFHYLWDPDENTWISKHAPSSRMAPFDIIIDGNGNKMLFPDYIGMGYIWIANKGWEFKRYELSKNRVLIGNNVIGPNFNGDVYIQAFDIDKGIPYDHEHLRLNRNAGYNLTQIMRDNGVDDFMKTISNVNI